MMPEVLAVPRAFHSATLLTDGTILIAGGVTAGGQFPDDVQLWNFQSNKILSQHASLATPRENHTAFLLSDGVVRISGGVDHFGQPAQVDEIFDPLTKLFRFASAVEMTPIEQAESVAESIPSDGATDVSIAAPIAVRFTQLLYMSKVSGNAFVLVGPNQSVVAARVTPAEHGRLVFVLPSSPLQSGTVYTLQMKGVLDANGSEMPATSITFQTAGPPSDPEGLDWIPNSTWTAGGNITRFQELSALQARSGVTALAGQVLKLNGWPLEHVTLEIDKKKTQTDSTGRFLLERLSPGHHVLWIDGTNANTPQATYGIYEAGVDIQAGKTNVLNYTIWMMRLDTAHAVSIPSPTRVETVINSPYLPGLELHLPAKTVITDRNGKVIRQVTVTPVPLDKPPFPLPVGVQVPIYFTIQPGGAYIKVLPSGNGTQGARLIYPNAFHHPPGTIFDFWNYDADVKGWYVYGQGQVSSDGLSVVPNPGVEIYEFTGAMVADPSLAKPQGAPVGYGANSADPVTLSTGQFVYGKIDLALPDVIPISLSRTYTTNDSLSRSFGIGAMASYDMFIVGNEVPFTYQELILPDGGRVRFESIDPGTSVGPYVATTANSAFYGATLTYNGPSAAVVLRDGTVFNFPASNGGPSACTAVTQITDRFGNVVKIDRVVNSCALSKITSPNGRAISLTTDTHGRITQAVDNIGRTVNYGYDTAGRLSTVTDVAGGTTTYTYDSQNRMVTIQDARQIIYLTNQYDSLGRVTQQTDKNGGIYLFNWTTANSAQTHFYRSQGGGGGGGSSVIMQNGCWTSAGFNRYDSADCGEGYMPLVAQVDVTDPRGYIRRVVFNDMGYVSSDTRALGQPEQQTTTYTYYADNLLQSVTDPLGRITTFDYDRYGNTTRITRLDGTPDAVTTTFAFNGPFNQLSSVTDPLNHSSTFAYDPQGNLTTATDPLLHSTILGHNGNGQLTSVTDALNNAVAYGYFGGDLASVTDPLGNTSVQFTDPVGRVTSANDAQGHLTLSQYNNLNLLTQVTDPRGGITSFSYDPNGNLLSLADAQHPLNPTTWTYDDMDRVQTRTDPLPRGESYSYDLMGNLSSSTDRKGQVTSLSYDALNRLTLVGYNTVVNGGVTSYESTVSYTYDNGNRMTQVVDSAGGTITETYDNLDRQTSETTAQGSISYGYDNASRRTSMTVAGQPQVSYSFDNANRLTQISQGTSTVGFGYDNANRRSTLTLSNGVNVSFTYDNDSRVTGIAYNFNTNPMGNLSYTYDSLGRRTLVGGSFARTGLPGAITSATYDVANELTNWNGTGINYDLNGNMLSDGTNTFTWNARNQVATLNNVSIQYDAFGRRIQNAAGKSFLYDGPNVAQELSGSTVLANLLSGGVDEVFTRADSSGSLTPLTDALGSTLGLVDASGSLVSTYSYDPYGNTISAGAANANEFQYTGRENEGNGLYSYRARYYSALLGRFISEDPLGFSAGVNFYRYVDDNPTGFTDPAGTDKNSGLKENVCSALPDGRTTGMSGYLGSFLGGGVGGGELLYNYNTGQVSAFLQGGYAGPGWNGFLTGGPSVGFVRNIGNDNANYAGPFSNASGGIGPFGLTVSASSHGMQGPLTFPKGGAQAVSLSFNPLSTMEAPVSGYPSVTYYTKPLDVGNFLDGTAPQANDVFSQSLLFYDRLMFLAKQLCK